MYESYSFIESNGNVQAADGWTLYRNHRGGVRIIPTIKSILSYYKRATTAALLDLVPKWSLR